MKRGFTKIAVGMVAAAFIFTSAVAYAEGQEQRGGPDAKGMAEKREQRFAKMAEDLGLSAEQIEQLKAQKAGHREQTKALMENLKTKREELRAELEKEEIDDAKIGSLVAEITALSGEKLKNRVESVLAMRSILTPEQFKQFREKMEEMKNKRGHHKGFKKRFHEGEGCQYKEGQGEAGPPPKEVEEDGPPADEIE